MIASDKHDFQWVLSLLDGGETSRVECKLAAKAIPDSFWESYSAFANTDGGIVLLGIKEENRRFSIEGVSDAKKLVADFWNTVNGSKVSANVVYDHNVHVIDCGGKTVIAIEIPRAERSDRPVHVGEDVFKGTYRRNGEGDYHCSREAVKAMIRDQCVETADVCVLDELAVGDLDADSVRRYRTLFDGLRPGHVWGTLPDDEFLVKIFNIFSLVKIGERSGIGLSNLFGVWEQSGYARPIITESFDPERTRVDVEIEVAEKSTEKRGKYTGKLTEKHGEYTGKLTEKHGECTEKLTERRAALTETEEKIVSILESNGYSTQKVISTKLGITRTYVTKIMGELQTKGVIRRIGPDKGGHWEVVK